MPLSMKITSILILTFIYTNAEAPPGYVKQAEPADKNPPKYEYGYNIEDEKGASHGKVETRDGIYALGRYYVQGVDSTHNVQYYADDWGYHPYIEYSNVGPHSKTRTQLLLGVEAVKALASNKFTPHSVPPKQHVTETISNKLVNSRGGQSVAPQAQENRPLQIVVEQQQQPQQIVVQQSPQLVAVEQQQQPQQIIVQQSPQLVAVEQPQTVHQESFVQQPPQVAFEQPQQINNIQQPEHINNIQQSGQSQQFASDESDSIVVEARNRPQQFVQEQQQQQQQAQQQQQQQQIINNAQHAIPQPQQQPQQILFRISHPQPQQNVGEQQLQQGQISHQFAQQLSFEQLPQPQALTLQSGALQQNDNQIQENLITNQQLSPNLHEHRSQETLQEGQINIDFGARLNAQGRKEQLIANTRNLVSGQNVLDINRALEQKAKSFESSTAKPLSASENFLGVSTVTESSLLNAPIVVADFDDKIVSSTEGYLNLQAAREQIYSTTASTVSTKSFGITEPSAILVTPRPVSTTFLAPITAGIQLENADKNRIEIQGAEASPLVASRESGQKIIVEIQKSLPYYLGKFEYEQNPSAIGAAEQTATRTTQSQPTIHEKAVENIELGKTLALPEFRLEQHDNAQQHSFPQGNIDLEQQSGQLAETSVKENCVHDQQEAQGIQHQVVQQVNSPLFIEKVVEKQVAVPVVQTKIVEKPVKVTEFVEKRVHVPQPYPVEKIVEKQVHVPFEVTRYIDRPYPVQVPVAQPVPYPVDRVVEKIVKQPYPVTVKVPVEVKVPFPVEKIVEKKVPVDRIVEKLVPHYIDRPYPVQVGVPVQVYTLQLAKSSQGAPLTTLSAPQPQKSYPGPVKTIKDYQQPFLLSQQLPAQEQVQLKQNSLSSNEYLPPPSNSAPTRVHDCDQVSGFSGKSVYYTIQPDDYIGLAPPRLGEDDVNIPRKFRNPRSNFNSNLRIEYGFKPPLRPSQEIDEHGQPIIREEP